jgi:hypothetical protein
VRQSTTAVVVAAASTAPQARVLRLWVDQVVAVQVALLLYLVRGNPELMDSVVVAVAVQTPTTVPRLSLAVTVAMVSSSSATPTWPKRRLA